MRVKLQICCHITRTSSGLRCVHSEPCHIRRSSSFADKHSNKRIFDFIADVLTTLCALYSTFAYKYSALQPLCGMSTMSPVSSTVVAILRFSLKYTVERSSANFRVMSTIPCALKSTFVAKYSADQPVCRMSTLSCIRSSVIAVLQIQS